MFTALELDRCFTETEKNATHNKQPQTRIILNFLSVSHFIVVLHIQFWLMNILRWMRAVFRNSFFFFWFSVYSSYFLRLLNMPIKIEWMEKQRRRILLDGKFKEIILIKHGQFAGSFPLFLCSQCCWFFESRIVKTVFLLSLPPHSS